MTFHVEPQFMVISNAGEVIAIRRIAKEMAQNMGFDERTREEISLVVSELASNIIKYTQRGIITLSPVCNTKCEGIMIEAEDDGEGFNEHTALKDGVSTSGTLGVGLGAVNRLMDEFEILQRENHSGTRIICKRWLHDNSNHGQHCPFEFGVFSRPKLNELANGDTFVIKNIHEATLIGVIDGVGHGVLANQAANVARQYVERHAESPLLDIFRGVERACSSTRGVVMALVVLNWKKSTFQYASVGNIEIKIFSQAHDKSRFIVRRGIVGKHAPPPVVTENEWHSGDMLALHSDGISTHWHWDDFMSYLNHPVQMITEEIFNAMQKNYDDATIVIVK